MATMLATIPSMPTPPVSNHSDQAVLLFTQYRKWLGSNPEDGRGDPEDYWEMAARLDAALHSGADEVWLVRPRKKGVPLSATNIVTGEKQPPEAIQSRARDLIEWGPIIRYSADSLQEDKAADRYFNSPVFLNHCGRVTQMAGWMTPNHLPDVMASFAHKGMVEVFVKDTRAKHGIWRLPATTDPDTNRGVAMEALEWGIVSAEDNPGAFLVQEAIEMRDEYRLFVVDGVPVTGAGCIEEHTPLNAVPGQPFSTELRSNRSAMSAVCQDPEQVDRLVKFGAEVAAEVGDLFGRAWTLDVCDTPSGPAMIEANTYRNSGLFATDPRRVTQALTRTTTCQERP